MRRHPSVLLALSVAILFSGCSDASSADTGSGTELDVSDSPSMSDTSSSSVGSDSYKGWKKYESDAGFSVMVPSKWKVDQWPGGMSVYNPANQFALFGGETVRLDQQILVESGNVKNMTASVENPEQGSCGKKSKTRVGSYEGFVQTCTFSLDGSMQRHFFVQGDGVVFHFVSRMDDKKLNPTFAKVRDSFRIEADAVR